MPRMMRAVQVSRANGPFELVERELPEPAPNQVRIRVEACGICHSDAFVKSGAYRGLQLPRIPGHEIAGRIDKVGANVAEWKPGDRAGVGWHGGHCFVCSACRKGLFINCEKAAVTGISQDGGYAEYVVVPHESVSARSLACAPASRPSSSRTRSRPTRGCTRTASASAPS